MDGSNVAVSKGISECVLLECGCFVRNIGVWIARMWLCSLSCALNRISFSRTDVEKVAMRTGFGHWLFGPEETVDVNELD